MANRKGRNYIVVSNEAWQDFKATALAQGESLGAAQQAAGEFASAAEKENPGVEHSFAVIEEAGVLTTTVQTKVAQNFTSSRTIVRRAKGEGSDTGEGTDTNESTPKAGRKRGRPSNK
jgi:hypothetical protein